MVGTRRPVPATRRAPDGSGWINATALLCRGIALLLALAVPGHAGALGLLVPAYFDPTSDGNGWNSLKQAAQRVPLIAIMNPFNGPSTSVIPAYVPAISSVRNAGGKVIGYVYSSYTKRAIADIKTDIDRYDSFYALDGIFVDEMTNDSDATHLAFYQELYQYIKAKHQSWLVAGNPGINTLEPYLTRPTADLLVTFENNVGYPQYLPDQWTQTNSATAFSHLCYAVATASSMTNFVNLAKSRNAGYIYVTDDSGANPWDTLPSYWSFEVALIESLNRKTASAQPSTLTASFGLNGTLRLRVDGTPGRYVIQTSTNFIEWEPMLTNVSASGSFSFLDSVVTNRRMQFYRAQE